jgi:SAM-dependent methyltransferase
MAGVARGGKVTTAAPLASHWLAHDFSHMWDESSLLEEQIRYYRERASEYDQWFLRQGRYDRGREHRRRWFAEIRQVEEALRLAGPRGDVLELACGTGIWTQRLLRYASSITAIDAAPEAIALNRERLQGPKVEYVLSDIFTWRPPRRYDFVFFGFWLTHVPPDRFERFWDLVARALEPGGWVFFVDSRHNPDSTATDHELSRKSHRVQQRRLNDGRTFDVIKVFYDPAPLGLRLQDLGWKGTIVETREFFIYGALQRDSASRLSVGGFDEAAQ